jgi:hypothetical protein
MEGAGFMRVGAGGRGALEWTTRAAAGSALLVTARSPCDGFFAGRVK